MSTVAIRPASVQEWPAIERLLTANRLPTAGARQHAPLFLVAIDPHGELVGSIGIERYEGIGLLRSVAVDGQSRGRGLGARLVDAALNAARNAGIETLYLLTTDAAEYFGRFGFQAIPRTALAPQISVSEELRGACPASATAMVLALKP